MKLKEVFQDLALGELQATPMVEVNAFEIQGKYLPKVIQAINRALENFYSMFYLKEEQVLVQLKSGISHYYLDEKYALSNHEEKGTKYIIDTDLKPFTNRVIQILSVSLLSGRVLPINDLHNRESILLPEYNCIHIPMDIGEDMMSVVYQAHHQKIPLTEPITSEFNIELPDAMYSAFMAYVLLIILNNMGGNKTNEANIAFQRYQSLMQQLTMQGIGYKTQTEINIKPYIRSWI